MLMSNFVRDVVLSKESLSLITFQKVKANPYQTDIIHRMSINAHVGHTGHYKISISTLVSHCDPAMELVITSLCLIGQRKTNTVTGDHISLPNRPKEG